MTPRGHCPVCHSRFGTSLTSCVCGWKMLDPMPRQDLELPPPVGFVLRAEHDRLIAEKDTEIARLREALLDATAHLIAAAASYRTYARRGGDIWPRAEVDAFFTTRARDYDRAAERARAALGDDND